ncbi:MAG TPA: alanine--tRNA ligase, partial [Alphaproteobacteria bacterium]|nr:alanine--tRNA ligase [Alphaproteobacteria bacterium]
GDRGTIYGPRSMRFTVTGAEKHLGDLYVHRGRVESGSLSVGDDVELVIDGERRSRLRANHSATHLLHAALRRTLGKNVTQKGSMVAPDRLRFDISHPKAVTADEISVIEAQVNQQIRANTAILTRLMEPDAAVEAGAMALFGEKYGDEVRMVTMGEWEEDGDGGNNFSVELCGGTHSRRTGDIGFFKVVSESAVAAGVRRIEGLSGAAAEAYCAARQAALLDAAALLKAPPAEVAARVAELIDERRKLERRLADSRRRAVTGGGNGEGAKDLGGVKFTSRLLDGIPAKELKGLADDLKAQMGSGITALVSVNEGKASLVVGVTEDLTERFSAVDLVRAGAAALGGKGGGGRPDMAQAGGPDGAKAAAALAAIEQSLTGAH